MGKIKTMVRIQPYNQQSLAIKALSQLLFWSYALFIVYMSLLPAVSVPEINLWDKLQHAGAYFVMAILAFQICSRRKQVYLATVMIIALGAILEMLQGFSPGRFGSWLDALANGVGAVIALGLFLSVSSKFKC